MPIIFGKTSSEWLCPNIREITLNNNIEITSKRVGQNFNFVLNYCIYAEGTVKTNCKSESEAELYIEKLRVSHKFVRQYFNPKEFKKNSEMSYVAENRNIVDI